MIDRSDQVQKAEAFAALHQAAAPLVLYNIWDAGSARAVEEAGAAAIATGSAAVAAAQGYSDAQALPLDTVIATAARIADSVSLPVTIDFEGGYGDKPADLKAPLARLLDTGIVGINFEDQIIGGTGLYTIEDQCARIAALRAVAGDCGVPLFINARTDLFLKSPEPATHADLLDAAIARAQAYAQAGASGFFAPLLAAPELVKELCARAPIPVNIMDMAGVMDVAAAGALGVARISMGPGPYQTMIKAVKAAASAHYR